jgi:hypothetical protein
VADIERMPEELADYFTWQDVDGLRSLAQSLSNNLGGGISVSPLLNLADRIAALLPPRSER